MSEAHLYGGFIEWAKDEVTARSHRQGEGVDVFLFFFTLHSSLVEIQVALSG